MRESCTPRAFAVSCTEATFAGFVGTILYCGSEGSMVNA
jgi:hypothetical protein